MKEGTRCSDCLLTEGWFKGLMPLDSVGEIGVGLENKSKGFRSLESLEEVGLSNYRNTPYLMSPVCKVSMGLGPIPVNAEFSPGNPGR